MRCVPPTTTLRTFTAAILAAIAGLATLAGPVPPARAELAARTAAVPSTGTARTTTPTPAALGKVVPARPRDVSARPSRGVHLTSTSTRRGAQSFRLRSARPVQARLDVTRDLRGLTRGTRVRAHAWVRSQVAGQRVVLVVRERSASGTLRARRTRVTPRRGAWVPLATELTVRRDHATVHTSVVLPRGTRRLHVRVDDLTVRVKTRRPATPTTPATPATGGRVLTNGCAYSPRGVPSCGAYLGATYGANDDPAPLESQIGRRLGVRRTFWTATGVTKAVATARADVAHGRLPWISFKLPQSWEAMAAGKGDAWAADLAKRLATVPGPVWVAFHHEPEGDGDITAWREMQEHLAPLVRRLAPNVAYTVVLTGWNQFFGAREYRLANLWPRGVTIDVAGFDLYNEYGVTKNGSTSTTWPNFDRDYYAPIQAWAARQGVAWGVAETAYTDAAHARRPGWIKTSYDQLVARGGVADAYFDTTLNAYGSWALSTPSKRADLASAARGSAALPVPR